MVAREIFRLLLMLTLQQKAALEVHDAEMKRESATPKLVIDEIPSTQTAESVGLIALTISTLTSYLLSQTIKTSTDSLGQEQTLRPQSDSRGRAGGRSINRGDLDQAIRSMREGKRRTRPSRPLSKIFVDGARNSRLYD